LTHYRDGKGQNNRVQEANQREPVKRKLGSTHRVPPHAQQHTERKKASQPVEERR
jgi:hypothetical protein